MFGFFHWETLNWDFPLEEENQWNIPFQAFVTKAVAPEILCDLYCCQISLGIGQSETKRGHL